MPLLALFIAVPLIEIALFVQVGQAVGLWWVLASVLVTALVGTWLVKRQGRGVLNRLRAALSEVRDPSEDLAHGAMILFSGALLLTPGYFTDAMGFLLLVPAVRDAVWRWLGTNAAVRGFATAGGRPAHRPQGDVIDADYREVGPRPSDPEAPSGSRPDKPSGWTRP